MLDSQTSDLIQAAQLVTYYLIGYNLHLCKVTKTYLCYFIVKILSKLSSATV